MPDTMVITVTIEIEVKDPNSYPLAENIPAELPTQQKAIQIIEEIIWEHTAESEALGWCAGDVQPLFED